MSTGKVILIVCGAIAALCVLGWLLGAASVVSHEVSPQELQRKYEWFKDQRAALDAKKADIHVQQQQMKDMENAYHGQPRSQWAREDREQYNIYSSQLTGLKNKYNSMAAEYNSEMVKWNWRFTNVGDLPAGETEVMPRSYAPYENS